MSLNLSANAKINLGLRILSKRNDGYHELITIFQRISLADRLTLDKINDKIEYFGPALTENIEDNLCYKAANVFRSRFGDNSGVRIKLEKIIPVGAGLGGGSSDAAAVLRGMRTLYNIPLDHSKLIEAASEVGADVPFFLRNIPSALGKGTGEILSPAHGLQSKYYLVVVKPDFSISTVLAYKLLDECLTFDKNNINMISHDFLTYTGGIITAQMTNDFEGPIFTVYPRLAEARNRMLNAGADPAGLCGSGSAIYGVFNDSDKAQSVANEWCSPWLSYVCRPF